MGEITYIHYIDNVQHYFITFPIICGYILMVSFLFYSTKSVALQANLVNWLNEDKKEIWQIALNELMVESGHVARNVTSLLSNFVRQGQINII